MRIVVTEYPKSGGSWLVSMLGTALDLPCRDVYIGNGYDRFDVSKHPWYRGLPSLDLVESCVIKSHELPGSPYVAFPAQFVHLMRDGRDVVVSKFYFERDFCVQNGIYEHFDTPFDEYLPRVAQEWRDYVFAWLDANAPVYTYEAFLSDPYRTLTSVVQELGHDLPAQRIRAAVDTHTKDKFSRSLDDVFQYNSFVRKGVHGDWRNYFTAEHAAIFKRVAGDALIRLGYEVGNSWAAGVVPRVATLSQPEPPPLGTDAAAPPHEAQEQDPGLDAPAPPCWCGNANLTPFSPHYLRCPACGTLVTAQMPAPEFTAVQNDDQDFYGREYWFAHQEHDLGQANIVQRARADLPERDLHWLRALLKYKLPPASALDLGGAHGGFVALLRWAGFEASGLELSPWVVEFARQTFGVPMLLGPIEQQSVAPGSLDVIALMDVLEHLPDPLGTMRHCLGLLKPDGMLLIQTPCYDEQKSYADLVAANDPFLVQLKHEQHLYLFSQRSVRLLFARLGAEHLSFEPAIFQHYDMFVAVSRAPLIETTAEACDQQLLASAAGRMALALLDLDGQHRAALARHSASAAETAALQAQLYASEADRAARRAVIERQGAELGRIPALEADVAFLKERLIAAEADRAARLAVIERQGAELGRAHQLAAEADKLLQKLPALARHGIALPREVKSMHQILERARTLLRHAVAPPATASASPAENPPPQPAVAADAAPQAPIGGSEQAFAQLREPKTLAPLNYTPEMIDAIITELRAYGFTVEDRALDPAAYRAYFAQADYDTRYPTYYSFNLPEKSLEHFVAATLLDLQADDTYIDIASEHSPVPEIYTRLFGCSAYRQDLAYQPGLNGDQIGGDAAAMPVPPEFATKMALHCSFEHFEGDADVRFIREIKRVLRAGGRVCFAPLYLFHTYAILTDPTVAVAQAVPFEEDATLYCKPGWLNRHGRFYDPRHLASRVQQQLDGMQMTIYRITNAQDVDPTCYIQFAAVIAKP